VLSVGFEIEEVVDDVGGGGSETEAEETNDRSDDETRYPGVSKKQRDEEEDVLSPLMEADGFEPGLEGGDTLVEGADRGDAGLAEGGAKGGGGVGDHGLLAAFEEGEVGERVADVGEVVAEVRLKGGELVFASEIELAVGGQDAGEETEMGGDAVGGVGVGGGGEVDGTAGGALLLKVLEELGIVGEVGDIELDRVGQMAFKGGFALEEPAGELQQRGWMMAGDGEGGVVEGVRLDEGSIQVDAEDWDGRDVDWRGRDVQKCPFLRLNQ